MLINIIIKLMIKVICDFRLQFIMIAFQVRRIGTFIKLKNVFTNLHINIINQDSLQPKIEFFFIIQKMFMKKIVIRITDL